jgi:hypothetical protein
VTLQQWLQEATGIFPAGVQKRLAQEYRAHLEESVAAGGIGDPVALFGTPDKVQHQLKNSYVVISRADELKYMSGFSFWMVAFFVLASTIASFVFESPVWAKASTTGALLMVTAIWKYTLSWPRMRQIGFRRLFSSSVSILVLTCGAVIKEGYSKLTFVYLILVVLHHAWGELREYVRIRRTLELEEVKA